MDPSLVVRRPPRRFEPVGVDTSLAAWIDIGFGEIMEKRTYQIGRSTLTLEFGDLTTSGADVLVSSDDSYVTMGGGVSAAILRQGGPSILFDAAKKIPARLGDVDSHISGIAASKIHIPRAITIGDEELGTERNNCPGDPTLPRTGSHSQLTSIAFPAIGAGAAGFSYEAVAVQMADVVVEFLKSSPRPIDASIYEYDRFGRMQPIDYVSFFEQFAVHAKGVIPLHWRCPA